MTARGRHTRRAVRRWEREQRCQVWYAVGRMAAAAGLALPDHMTRADRRCLAEGYRDAADGAR